MAQCTATSKRSGEQCRRLAIVGGTVCHMHGGAIPNVKKAALRRLAREHLERQVWELVDELDLPMDEGDDPGDVLAAARRRASTMASVLWVVVQQLGVATDVDVLYSPDERVIRSLAGGSSSALKVAALFGPDHEGDGAPHVATEMLRKWNLQSAQLAKMELDAGIDERRTLMAEATGRQLGDVIRIVTDGLLELALSQLHDGADRSALREAWSSTSGPLVRHAISVAVPEREPVPRPAFPVRSIEVTSTERAAPVGGGEVGDVDGSGPSAELIPPASASTPAPTPATSPPGPRPAGERPLRSGVVVDDDDPGDAVFVARTNAAEGARRQAVRDALEDERRRGETFR